MTNRYAWVALGLGAYIAFALSTFPAAAAYRWFAPAELRLVGIEGTVWSGRAALASVENFAMRDLRWSIDALPLLIGRVNGRVRASLGEGFVESIVKLSPSGDVELTDLRMSTSLASLASALPVGDIRGQLAVMLERLELRDGWPVDAAGQVRLARLSAPTFAPSGRGSPVPLGDYELTFVGTEGDQVVASLRDAGGPLEVAGRVTLGDGRRYRLDARVAPRADASPELVRALDFIAGEPGPDGKRPFELTGSL
ncbi:MAG: type II secretion system protein N [Gammaproteobacteria bacterium]|nr:hypothetical protein [Gammaproteobacteria bacterium]